MQAQADTLTGLPSRTAAQNADLAVLEDRLVSLRATYATCCPMLTCGSLAFT
jgi:hypothetical protein